MNAIDSLGSDLVGDLDMSREIVKNLMEARNAYLATKCKLDIDPQEARKARDQADSASKRARNHVNENPTSSYSDTIDILDDGVRKLKPGK